MNSYSKNMNDTFDAPAMRGMHRFFAVIISVVAVAAVAAAAVVAAAAASFVATNPPVIS